jgi:hypothetical protein
MTDFIRYYQVIEHFTPKQTTVDASGRWDGQSNVVYSTDGQMWRQVSPNGATCQDCGNTKARYGYGLCSGTMTQAGKFAAKSIVKQFVCKDCAVVTEAELPATVAA